MLAENHLRQLDGALEQALGSLQTLRSLAPQDTQKIGHLYDLSEFIDELPRYEVPPSDQIQIESAIEESHILLKEKISEVDHMEQDFSARKNEADAMRMRLEERQKYRSVAESRQHELENQTQDLFNKIDDLTEQLDSDTERIENSLMREEDLRGNILILESRRQSLTNAAAQKLAATESEIEAQSAQL